MSPFVTVGAATYKTLNGDFGDVPAAGLTAPLGVVADAASEFGGLSAACAAFPAGSLAGKIALLSRGICDFTVKVQNAQNAGAVGVLMVDRADGGPIVMGTNDDPVQPTIPGVHGGAVGASGVDVVGSARRDVHSVAVDVRLHAGGRRRDRRASPAPVRRTSTSA